MKLRDKEWMRWWWDWTKSSTQNGIHSHPFLWPSLSCITLNLQNYLCFLTWIEEILTYWSWWYSVRMIIYLRKISFAKGRTFIVGKNWREITNSKISLVKCMVGNLKTFSRVLSTWSPRVSILFISKRKISQPFQRLCVNIWTSFSID